MMEDRNDSANQFVNHLYALQRAIEGARQGGSRAAASKARGALAQLRRTVGKPPGAAVAALPHVVPHLRENAGPWEREAYFLVAALFAHHPTPHEARENLGDALRQTGEHESAEKRFTTLLNCRPERLGYHLRQAVRLAESKEIAVNYRRLLFDLLDWDHPDHYVQLRWARGYWRPQQSPQGGGATTSEGGNTP